MQMIKMIIKKIERETHRHTGCRMQWAPID